MVSLKDIKSFLDQVIPGLVSRFKETSQKIFHNGDNRWNCSFVDESTKDTMITPSSETILHGLKKYTNYSMEILAYTSGGDGVRSNMIHCQTDQDGRIHL